MQQLTNQDKFYFRAVAGVLGQTQAYQRSLASLGRRTALPGGLPYRFVGTPIYGPQCATVSLQIRDQDLKTVEGLGDRLAHRTGAPMARVYRDLSLVRLEFTLPKDQWREVQLGRLPHRGRFATIGQKALGPVARLGFDPPHKAIFGGTQSGKTTCLADIVISLARTHSPEDLQFLILNPKNDAKLSPFARLPHLVGPVSGGYDDSETLLRLSLAEMERRKGDPLRCRQRLLIIIDEIARLTEVLPQTGPMITSLSQVAAGLNINLIAASQAANPSTFGKRGSLAQANFGARIVFQLPNDQAWMAGLVKGLNTGSLGRDGDAYAINAGRVTRIRAAWPAESDYANLPRTADPPLPPASDHLAGDALALAWPLADLADRAAFALVDQRRRTLSQPSASAIQRKFGGAMDRARWVRDLMVMFQERVTYWEIDN